MYLDVHVCALYVHERMCMMDVRFLRHAKKTNSGVATDTDSCTGLEGDQRNHVHHIYSRY